MEQEHAFLQAAWESNDDTCILLIFADWLDDGGQAETAEVLRLVVAENSTARHSKERADRLRKLRNEVWETVKQTPWPELAIQGNACSAMSFSRRLSPSRPGRECILVRFEQRSVRWFRVELDGDDEVTMTREGRPLCRRPLPAHTLQHIRAGYDYFLGSSFNLGYESFPLPEGWQGNPQEAYADRHRRIEEAFAAANVQLADLPVELVPYVAWGLCEFVSDKGRRVRGGRLVPGGPHLPVQHRPDGLAACGNRRE
jgi:uncharacterized protein (TIGR02996 family)